MGYEHYLVALMDEKGMKQSDLARVSGVSKSAISRYIQHGADIPVSKARKLAEALGVTVDELLQTNHVTTEEEELLNKYRHLSEASKQLVLQLIDSLK